MKLIFTALLLSSSSLALSNTLIPVSEINLYGGSFSDIEADLKQKIKQAGSVKCGSLSNASFGKISITFTLNSLYDYDPIGEWDVISGAYPRAGATVSINCRG